jgi:hypothetical protein
MIRNDDLPEPIESAVMIAALPMAAALAFLCVLVVNIGSVLLLPFGLACDAARSVLAATTKRSTGDA